MKAVDARVATEVMGWESQYIEYGGSGGEYVWVLPNGEWQHEPDVPDYSTSIAAAWAVVEKMEKLGFRMDLESGWENLQEYRAYKVRFYKPHYLEEAQSEHAPLAICRAALKAVEGE